MRIITLLFLLIAASVCTFAQDIIILKDERVIKAKIIEVGHQEIVYKRYNYDDGPICYLFMSDVAMIKYANGDIDSNKLFYYVHETAPSIGVGAGLDYGFFGVRYNHKLGEKNNFAYQIGAGYFEEVILSVGVKHYFYKEIYIDATGSISEQYSNIFAGAITLGGDFHLYQNIGLNISCGVGSDFKEYILPAFGLGLYLKL